MLPKQVILVRTDLNMRKGKIASQTAHASFKVFLDRATVETLHGDTDVPCLVVSPLTPEMVLWLRGKFTKIVLGVESEADLVRAYTLAQEAGLPTAIIQDAGQTEFHGVPTLTACAIGPADPTAIDKITGPEGAVKCKLL